MTTDERAHALLESCGWRPEQKLDSAYIHAHKGIVAVLRETANDALERAAASAEFVGTPGGDFIAAAIRALKEPTP